MARKSQLNADILIVGGGFSGVTLAANLARMQSPAKVVVSRKPDAGPFGIAYETDCPLHLLNVPAKTMSAFRDQPSHFTDWATDAGYAVAPDDFAPRRIYREYLGSLLERSIQDGGVEVVDEETIGAQQSGEGWTCTLSSGQTVTARNVVISFGGFPPAPIPELTPIVDHSGFRANPWKSPNRDELLGVCQIGIVGSGLTALDVVLNCEAEGFEGTYTMLSRHGLLPQAHRLGLPHLSAENLPQPVSDVRDLVRQVRAAVAVAAEAGVDWRSVIDGMRPYVSMYWLALGEADRVRFIRHVRSFWEIHRHRVAPVIADRIDRLRRIGRLSIRSGRILASADAGRSVELSFVERRDTAPEKLRFDMLFNCTGPANRVTAWPSPLIQGLLCDGLARTDPLLRGIDSDEHGEVVNRLGDVQPGLYVLGHLRRGQLWESTAVRELREQAADLGEHLLKSFSSDFAESARSR